MNSNLSANAEINLASRLANIKSIDEMASQAVRLCAEAAEASICTFWRRYDDPDDQPRLRLAAAYGVEAPASLAQEVTYAIAAKKESFEHIGITGYVASARERVLVNSFKQLLDEYGFCHTHAEEFVNVR